MTGLLVARTNIIPVVSALPTNPYHGQEIYYEADATNGVYWHLVFRSLKADGTSDASSFKWHFLGGGSLSSEVNPGTATSETRTSTSYGDLATTGPTITTPLAGDYEVLIGCIAFDSSNTLWMSYAIGATTAVDADGAFYGGLGVWGTITKTRVKAGLAASTALTAKYKVGGGTGDYRHRWMRLTPIRVG